MTLRVGIIPYPSPNPLKKTPPPKVLEVRGWVPEADTALEEFRFEVLKCYDGTLEGVADIHQVCPLARCQ